VAAEEVQDASGLVDEGGAPGEGADEGRVGSAVEGGDPFLEPGVAAMQHDDAASCGDDEGGPTDDVVAGGEDVEGGDVFEEGEPEGGLVIDGETSGVLDEVVEPAMEEGVGGGGFAKGDQAGVEVAEGGGDLREGGFFALEAIVVDDMRGGDEEVEVVEQGEEFVERGGDEGVRVEEDGFLKGRLEEGEDFSEVGDFVLREVAFLVFFEDGVSGDVEDDVEVGVGLDGLVGDDPDGQGGAVFFDGLRGAASLFEVGSAGGDVEDSAGLHGLGGEGCHPEPRLEVRTFGADHGIDLVHVEGFERRDRGVGRAGHGDFLDLMGRLEALFEEFGDAWHEAVVGFNEEANGFKPGDMGGVEQGLFVAVDIDDEQGFGGGGEMIQDIGSTEAGECDASVDVVEFCGFQEDRGFDLIGFEGEYFGLREETGQADGVEAIGGADVDELIEGGGVSGEGLDKGEEFVFVGAEGFLEAGVDEVGFVGQGHAGEGSGEDGVGVAAVSDELGFDLATGFAEALPGDVAGDAIQEGVLEEADEDLIQKMSKGGHGGEGLGEGGECVPAVAFELVAVLVEEGLAGLTLGV